MLTGGCGHEEFDLAGVEPEVDSESAGGVARVCAVQKLLTIGETITVRVAIGAVVSNGGGGIELKGVFPGVGETVVVGIQAGSKPRESDPVLRVITEGCGFSADEGGALAISFEWPWGFGVVADLVDGDVRDDLVGSLCNGREWALEAD